MIKKILLCVICAFFLWGCSDDNDFPGKKEDGSIQLKAPNGEMVAPNLKRLTMMVDEIAEIVYKEDKSIEVQSVSFYETTVGFIAKVKYLTYDGYVSSMIITNVSLDKGTNVRSIKTRSEEGDSKPGLTIYTCVSKGRKKCPDCEVDYHTGLGIIRCSCSKGQRKYCHLVVEEP